MILSKVYEDAERRLERNEITLGEFERLVDIEVIESKRGEWINVSGSWSPNEKCSVCGEVVHEYNYNFCPNCGARMKTADERDYERAIEQMQHDILYEPTYNPEDGSM